MGDLGDPWFPKENILQVVDFPCLSCVVCLGGLGTLMTGIFSMRIMKLIIQGGSVFLQTLWNSCSTSSHVYLYWLNRLNLMFSWFNHLKLPVLLSRSCWIPNSSYTVCWFATWILFFHSVGNVIIPTDEVILFRGVGLNHQPMGYNIKDY